MSTKVGDRLTAPIRFVWVSGNLLTGRTMGEGVGFLQTQNPYTDLNPFVLLVGRPGLDPGTLGVFPECPGTFLNVQICWPEGVERPPTSTEVLSRLNSWLDSWLDPGPPPCMGRPVTPRSGIDHDT